MNRRTLLTTAALAPAAMGLAPAFAQDWDPGITDFDKVFGDPEAPVTLIEYASYTCGHCAAFHNETFPEVQSAYIDTGLVRFVFRDFPLDGVALYAGMLARCLPDAAFKPMVDLLFEEQRTWIQSDDHVLALIGYAQMAGMSRDAAEACLSDEGLAQRIVALRQQAESEYGVNSTPTFVLEGEVFSGALSFEEMASRIDAVLPSN